MNNITYEIGNTEQAISIKEAAKWLVDIGKTEFIKVITCKARKELGTKYQNYEV